MLVERPRELQVESPRLVLISLKVLELMAKVTCPTHACTDTS